MSEQNTEPAMVCSLSSRDLRTRREMLRATLVPHIVSVETISTGLRVSFPATPAVREKVETLVGLERQCCGFLSFEVTPGDKSLALTIEGPPEAKDTLNLFANVMRSPQ